MKRTLAVIAVAIIFFCLFVGIFPLHDDWAYATAPNPDFTLSLLLPDSSFWRPFDVLWGALLSYAPSCFPLANRVLLSLGHALNGLLLFLVFRELNLPNKLFGTAYFVFSAAIAAALANTDALNQIYSFLCGSAALLCALRGRRFATPLLLVLSLFCKESGASWLAIVPMTLFWRDRSIPNFLRGVLFSCIIFATYIVTRFVLQGSVQLGGGYYELSFAPLSILRNMCIGTLLPVSGIDALAGVCGKKILFALSAIFTVVFWAIVLSNDRKTLYSRATFTALSAIALALPHCFFKTHHPAEMHFYPVLFAGAFFLSSLPAKVRWHAVAALSCLFVISWGDKMTELVKHSRETEVLYKKIAANGIDFSRTVYFVEGTPPAKTYSVFRQSAAHGVDFGKAFRKLNNWQNFSCKLVDAEKGKALKDAGEQVILLE